MLKMKCGITMTYDEFRVQIHYKCSTADVEQGKNFKQFCTRVGGQKGRAGAYIWTKGAIYNIPLLK